jgi:F0F1-type ATP synthase membrane subunit b/b'
MLPSLQEHILQAGTVDLDGSYLAQLAIFIVFAVILNFLVVKPLGRLQELRYSRMAGARIDAEKMDLRAAEARNSYQGSISDARTAAVSLRERARDAATTSVRASVESVKDESSRSLQAGRAVLNESAEKSRDQLDQEITTLAALIADQLLDTKRNAA